MAANEHLHMTCTQHQLFSSLFTIKIYALISAIYCYKTALNDFMYCNLTCELCL